MTNSLRQGFFWLATGRISIAASRFVNLMVLAKLGTPEIVGVYALALAVQNPIQIVFNLQFPLLRVSEINGGINFPQFTAMRLALVPLLFLTVFVSALLFGKSYNMILVFLVVGILRTGQSFADLIRSEYRANENFSHQSISQVLASILITVSFAIAFYVSQDLVTALCAQVFALTCSLAVYDLQTLKKTIRLQQVVTYLRQIRGLPFARALRCGLPLVLASFLIEIQSTIPRLVIESYIGLGPLGIFSALMSILQIPALLVDSVGNTVHRRLAQHANARERKLFVLLFLKSLLFSAVIGLTFAAFFFLFGSSIISAIFTSEYADKHSLLNAILIYAFLISAGQIMGLAVVALKEYKQIVRAHLVATILLPAAAISLAITAGENGVIAGMALVQICLIVWFGVVTARAISQWGNGRPAPQVTNEV